MSTVAPFTWTPTKQVLTSPAVPATGLWWRDFDHAEDTGTDTVWFPVPLWSALDFAYLPGGQLLILMAGPHENGLRSVLRVYRFDGSPDAQTSLGYAELESSEVSGAALGVRAGIVEVFYTHNQTLKRKESRDGGETFGNADTYNLTNAAAAAFTLTQATWAVGNGNMEACARGGFVAFDYLPGGNLAMILQGRTAGLGVDDNFIVKAAWDGSAWIFGSVGRISASSTLTLISGIQALHTGDPLLLPWGRQVTKLKSDGTFTLANTPATLNTQFAGVHEPTNQMLLMFRKPGNNSDGSGSYKEFSTQSYRFVPATPAWTFVGESSFFAGEWLKGWVDFQTNGSIITTFSTAAGKVRRRRDGRWECLLLNRDEQPALFRCAKAPMAGVGTSFS